MSNMIDDRVELMSETEVKAVLSFLLKNTRIVYTDEPMTQIESMIWIDNAIKGIVEKDKVKFKNGLISCFKALGRSLPELNI